MTRSLAVAWCVLLSASACNVATVQEQLSAIPQNSCTSDADCALGSCDGKICRTTNGSFDTILFEITPPADASSIAGVQFIETEKNVLEKNDTLDLQLDLLAKISGVVKLAPDMCTPQFVAEPGKLDATSSDRSIPALITLTPSSGALGLFSSPVAATATLADMSSFGFSLNVPVGHYDIYIQPQDQPTADCPVPPQLLRNHLINGTVNLSIALSVPQTFEFHVTWPLGDGALDGWSVDMLDPISGHAISKRVALERGKKTDYAAKLVYLPVVGDSDRVDQFVRLSPPDGVPAPTLLFARSGLGLFSATVGTLTQFKSLPTPVRLVGGVTEGVTPKPLAATVTLVATKINGVDPGVVASFVRRVDVQQDGSFALDVLPGTYRVAAVPAGVTDPAPTSLAEARTEWVVGDTPSVQAGKVIELSDTLPINGVVLDPSETTAMVGAQVNAVSSPTSVGTDALRQALGETVFMPRAKSATVEGGGSFSVSVDTGNYDFSVRPRSSSGYAWLVIPSLPVVANNGGAGLNTISLPLPVSYHGNLTVPGAADSFTLVPGALISAYIYMKDGQYTADSTQADSVLQIAETRSDATGAFDLRIPAALNAAPTPQ